MTREQRRYHKRCVVHCVLTGIVCFAIVLGVSLLVNAI